MISRATMNLKPVVIELDDGPIWKCPLWVISGHVQCTHACPLASGLPATSSRHRRRSGCLRVNRAVGGVVHLLQNSTGCCD
jgi:hypothetical protein